MKEDRFAIVRRFRMGNNSYQTWFVGRIVATLTGSEIRGNFRPAKSAMMFSAVWLSFVFLIGTGGTIMGTGRGIGGHLAFAVLTAGMMLAGSGLVRFGRWLARNDERVIAALIMESLVAKRLD